MKLCITSSESISAAESDRNQSTVLHGFLALRACVCLAGQGSSCAALHQNLSQLQEAIALHTVCTAGVATVVHSIEGVASYRVDWIELCTTA